MRFAITSILTGALGGWLMWDAAELFVPEEQETEQAKFQHAINLRLLEQSTLNTLQTQWDSIYGLYGIWVKNNQLGVTAHLGGETIGDETIKNLDFTYEHIRNDLMIMMKTADQALRNLNLSEAQVYGQMGAYLMRNINLDRDTFLILMGRQQLQGTKELPKEDK